MSVKVSIFYPRLKPLIKNSELLHLTGNTVGECLRDLVRQFPDTEKWLFDERGQLLRHVYVYINEESIHKPGLSAPVKDRDKLIIVSLIAGG